MCFHVAYDSGPYAICISLFCRNNCLSVITLEKQQRIAEMLRLRLFPQSAALSEQLAAHFSLTLVRKYGNHRTKPGSCGTRKSLSFSFFSDIQGFLIPVFQRLRLCRSHVRTVSGTPKKDPPDGGSFFGVPTGEFCFSKTPGKRRAEPAFACQSTPFERVRIRGGFASYLCLPFKAIPYRVRKGLHVRLFLCHWFVNPFTTDSLYGIIYNYPSSCTVYGWTNENDGVHKWTKNG